MINNFRYFYYKFRSIENEIQDDILAEEVQLNLEREQNHSEQNYPSNEEPKPSLESASLLNELRDIDNLIENETNKTLTQICEDINKFDI